MQARRRGSFDPGETMTITTALTEESAIASFSGNQRPLPHRATHLARLMRIEAVGLAPGGAGPEAHQRQDTNSVAPFPHDAWYRLGEVYWSLRKAALCC